jgi:hypothetical protein
MNTKPTEDLRWRWKVALGWLLIIGGGTLVVTLVALCTGAVAGWLWTWGQVGWRAMRWLLGVA